MASLSTAKVAPAPTIKSAFSYDSATLAVRKDRLCCQVPACQLSGKLVSRQQALDLARDLVKREEGGGYRCTKCGKLFSRIIGNCREHVWRTHYNIYLYKCNKSPGCHRKFRLVCNFVVLDTRTMLVSV